MDLQKKRNKKDILWMISPLHKEQVEKIKEVSAHLKERFGLLPKQYKRAIVGGLGLIMVFGTIYGFSNADKAFAVNVNGKKVAVVQSEEKARDVLNQVVSERSKEVGQKVETTDKVTYEKTKAKNLNLDGSFSLKRKLNKALTYTTTGTAIAVNGEVKVVLLNEKAADNVLSQIAKNYTSAYKDVTIDKVEYLDKVEKVKKKIKISQATNENDAIDLLMQGNQKLTTYKVDQGDTVWVIARKNKISTKDIQDANPGLNIEKLKLGQEINLNKVEPMINMRVYAKGTSTEAIAYTVQIDKDSTMLSGQDKIKQKGEIGLKDAKYNLVLLNGATEKRDLIEQNVTKQPKTQIVARGTKFIVASRGSGGTGQLGWPISGPINQRFGWHPGIDIGGPVGTPIGAAGDGTVVMAGWGIGKEIIIDHGNGLRTIYGHLSTLNAAVGDHVSRGQIIGAVGMTGRTTGPHLHFEVRINGAAVNPLNYLR